MDFVIVELKIVEWPRVQAMELCVFAVSVIILINKS